MKAKVDTPQQYLEGLPEDRVAALTELRQVIVNNLPSGFTETIGYGMLAYVVPHALYPGGYHCDTKLPLPFINIASQKNFVAIYHMGLYADPELLQWFTTEYPKHAKYKLDMGKSCIRFKKLHDIPYKLLGELASKMTVDQWIALYELQLKK